MSTQDSVSVRELRSHLSRYLAQVRAGGSLEVTAHRKVIARICKAPDPAASGIARLLAEGAAEWGGGKPVGADIELSTVGGSVSELVLEDRG